MSLFRILLNSNNYGVFHRPIAHAIGLHANIFLSELLDKHDYLEREKLLTDIEGHEGKWFYLTVEEVWERTTLSEREQRTVRDHLVSLGFISQVNKGMPCKRYFQIHEEVIQEYLSKNVSSSCVSQNKSCETQNKFLRSVGTSSCKTQELHNIYTNPLDEPDTHKEDKPPDKSPFARKLKKSKKKAELVERTKGVWITDLEYANLIQDFGQELVDRKIRELSEWIDREGDKFSNHALAVRKWCLRDQPNGKVALTGSNVPRFERISNALRECCSEEIAKGEIQIGAGYIEFIRGSYYARVADSDKAFISDLRHQLNKASLHKDFINEVCK